LFLWTIGPRAEGAEIQNLFAILILGASQFLTRKKANALSIPEPAHQVWIVITSLALWGFVSRWVIIHSGGAHFYLTGSWALVAFALFGIGFVLREIIYRWAALTIIACALARVVTLDVWKLQTINRILSLLALGVVLLALGYVYTRRSIATKPAE
jgi:hypothetical protein